MNAWLPIAVAGRLELGLAQAGTSRVVDEQQTAFIVLLVMILPAAVWAVSVVPLSLELLSPSGSMSEHRRALSEGDTLMRSTGRLIPALANGWDPARFWGAIYVVSLISCFVAGFALDGWFHEGARRSTSGGAVGAALTAAIPGLHWLMILFGRALQRASERQKRTRSRAGKQGRAGPEPGAPG